MNVVGLVAAALVVVGFGVGIAALTLALDVVMPRLIRRARNTAEQMPIRSGIVGVVNFAFFGVISVAIFSIAQGAAREEGSGSGLLRFIGAVMVLVLIAFFALGIAAVARLIGERLAPNRSAPRQILGGIVTLELAALAPVVGWIFVPSVVVLVGYGAVIIALVWRRADGTRDASNRTTQI